MPSSARNTCRPPATRSSRALVGRLKFRAVFALPMAIFTLPSCVSSIFSKRIRLAPASTIAMATAQLFLRASASAAVIAFFASSSVMYFVVPGTVFSFPNCYVDDPYGTAIPNAHTIDLGRRSCDQHSVAKNKFGEEKIVSGTTKDKTLEDAKKAMTAAEAEPRKNNW